METDDPSSTVQASRLVLEGGKVVMQPAGQPAASAGGGVSTARATDAAQGQLSIEIPVYLN